MRGDTSTPHRLKVGEGLDRIGSGEGLSEGSEGYLPYYARRWLRKMHIYKRGALTPHSPHRRAQGPSVVQPASVLSGSEVDTSPLT